MGLIESILLGLLVGISLIVLFELTVRLLSYFVSKDLLILWLRIRGGKVILEPLAEE